MNMQGNPMIGVSRRRDTTISFRGSHFFLEMEISMSLCGVSSLRSKGVERLDFGPCCPGRSKLYIMGSSSMVSDGRKFLHPGPMPCYYGLVINNYRTINNYITGGRSSSRSAALGRVSGAVILLFQFSDKSCLEFDI